MSSNWPEIPLTDIYDIGSGLSKPAEAFGSGFPFLSFKDVFGNYFVPDALKSLVQSSVSERQTGSIKRGDVFLTRTSETLHELGMSCVALKDYPNATFNGFTKRLRPKKDAQHVVHPEYAGYYLRSLKFRREMLGFSTMSTRASLNNEMIGRLRIVLPPFDTQVKIAKALSCLDAKAEVNRDINQTLEDMALAIFKSWFITFDPVKSRVAALEKNLCSARSAMACISGMDDVALNQLPRDQYAELRVLAELFPDKFYESVNGTLPDGWFYNSAEAISSIGIGKTPPRKEPHWFTDEVGDWRWVSIRDMAKDGLFQQASSEYLTAEAISRFNIKIVPNNTVLLSFKLTVGRLSITDGPLATNEAIAHFNLSDDAPVTSEYLYLYLKGFDYSSLGSTSSIANAVNSKTIREMPVLCPTKEVLAAFDCKISPLFREIKNRQSEILHLVETRETLLPKLISGEVEVPL